MHRYVWVLVGRLTLALSPHRRLRDRPTTAMRSGPTQGTCLRGTCRFLFFLTGISLSPFSLLLLLGRAEPPRWARTTPWASFFSLCSSFLTCITTHRAGGWFVYSGLGYCGVKSDMPSPRSPRRRRGLACRVSSSLSTSKFQFQLRVRRLVAGL